MIDIAKGRYWDLPWSLVSGCTPCSPGCERCWSAAMTHRFDVPEEFKGEKRPFHIFTDSHGRFNGEIVTHPERLSIPLKRRKPTVYAVWNDLFHEAASWEFIGEAMNVMYEHSRHTYLVLTKRPQNMFDELNSPSMAMGKWPDHIWFGLTVCNQQEADAKIPAFLKVPGKKFLSIEPMLGPVDLDRVPPVHMGRWCGFGPSEFLCDTYKPKDGIDAVILGGETGPGARPMHPDWVRSVRDQCRAAGVPFFFKQWGEWQPLNQMGYVIDDETVKSAYKFLDPRTLVYRVGRKRAGRLLDGRTHDELPWGPS